MGGITTAIACLVSAAAGMITGYLIGYCVGKEDKQ